MKDKKLKQTLHQTYAITPSQKEYSFLRRYQKRQISVIQVLKIELKYMGVKSLLAGLIIWTILKGLTLTGGNTKIKWVIASILPVFSLVLTEFGGRSERYGMEELEASSRFSLRLVKMIRMCLLGIFSFIMILGTTMMFYPYLENGFLQSFCLVSIPCMVNIWGCLWLLRNWHARESIYGCIGITMVTCLMPSLVQNLHIINNMSQGFIYTILVIIVLAICKEAWAYVGMSLADAADENF